MKRILRPLPRMGIHMPPRGAWLVDGVLDYETEDAAPPDAVYVAERGADGSVSELVNALPPGKAHRHERKGWPTPHGKPKDR